MTNVLKFARETTSQTAQRIMSAEFMRGACWERQFTALARRNAYQQGMIDGVIVSGVAFFALLALTIGAMLS